MGCVTVSNGGVFLIEGSRCVVLLLFGGYDIFSPLVELFFRLLVILPQVADFSFWPPLVLANDSIGSYGRFNLKKIWPMFFWHPLLPIVVEHSVPLLRSPQLWSLLLVEIAILVTWSCQVPWLWSFLKQWTSPDARKMTDKDLVVCFNVILFYTRVSVVKGLLF